MTKGVLAGLIVALIPWVAGCPGGDVFVPPDGNVVLRDDFGGGNLEGDWEFLGAEESKLSVTEREGFLRVSPQDTGASCDEPEQSYLVLERTGDFIVETKMNYEAEVDLTLAGIAVEDDEGKTAALGMLLVAARGAGPSFEGILLRVDQCPDSNPRRTSDPFAFDEVYLRLERTGDVFAGSYSRDGTSFTQLGALTQDMADTVRVGVGIISSDFCTSNCAANVFVDFDYFEVSLPEAED